METLLKGHTYKVKQIKENKPLFMNYGIIEEAVIRILDKSIDEKTIYLEVMGFNRKIAISSDLLNKIILEEFETKKTS